MNMGFRMTIYGILQYSITLKFNFTIGFIFIGQWTYYLQVKTF